MPTIVATRLITIAIAMYLVWILATYLLEGRIHLLQKPNPFGRLIYVVIANMIIGTAIAIWLLKPSIINRVVNPKQLGFQSSVKRVVVAIVIAGLIGFLVFIIQKPASLNPIVILNVFSQTLPASIAEVMICWVIVGTTFESTFFRLKPKKVTFVILAASVSTMLFGISHFAHSPPFNQPSMVLFLTYPGILTSIVYFIGRDSYATIVFHNFQALFGVMNNVKIDSLLYPIYPVVVVAIVSIVILVLSDLLVIRKTKVNTNSTCMHATT